MSAQVKKAEKNVVDNVLAKVNQFQQTGELKLPNDYSVENALKSAYLILSETKDKQGKIVLENCSKVSIANSLLDMATQGLSPMKKQCYFTSYNGQLQMQRSYQGSIAIARRAGLKSVVANVIYEKDNFVYKINIETGLKEIVNHEQTLENIDLGKIKGAYALTTMEDGTRELTIMTIAQIKKAWLQGYAKGNSGAHTNFTDEMCKKTVINRACKGIINSSTDGYLFDDENRNDEQHQESNTAPKNANTETIDIEDVEEVETVEEVVSEQPSQPVEEPEF